jgi:gluconate 5-dehydrogenase
LATGRELRGAGRSVSPVGQANGLVGRSQTGHIEQRDLGPVTSSLFDLSGRRALVTGSTRGIGRAIAAGMARAGATVVVHGRDPVKAEETERSVFDDLAGEGLKPRLLSAGFDVTDPDAVHVEVQRLELKLGGIDILVNNAGIQLRSSLEELSLDAWDKVLATNLTSCLLLAQELARGMLARGAGKVINVCSVQNVLVRPTNGPYAVAKAGLGSLTRMMCAEWAARGVQVNGLAPGYIGTELNSALTSDPEMSAWVVARTPARRWGTTADIVGPAVWLASGASDFVNGQIIYVDGGITAVV